jgi:hypothetical protein
VRGRGSTTQYGVRFLRDILDLYAWHERHYDAIGAIIQVAMSVGGPP